MEQSGKNSEILPVEKRKIRGLAKHVLVLFPGLHEQWVTPRKFIHYVFPPTKLPNGDYVPGSKERWLESMSFMLDDIWWLCELQYHQFWSQIIFDPGSMNSIKSFLHLAPLQQLYFKIDDLEILSTYKRIKKAVFQFMKRLLRIKESDLNFMSAEKYAEIMKKHNLVPASLLFCLCTLYAKKELDSVREMVAHVVQYNENLKLDSCVVRTIQLFSRMKTKLKKAYCILRSNMNHSQSVDDVRLAVNTYRQILSSSVQFLANAAISIHNFLLVYVEGCELFLAHDFDFHIIRVYKKLIIPTYLQISHLYVGNRHGQSYSKLVSMLELTRLEFVKSFHICLNALVEKFSTRLLAQETIQRIVHLMKMGSKIDNFHADVNSVRNLNEFHEHIKKRCPNDVDLTTLDNVFESISKELSAAKEEPDTIGNCNEDDDIFEYVEDEDDNDNLAEFENDEEIESGNVSVDECSSEYSDWSRNENSDAEYECYLDEDGPSEAAVATADSTPMPMSEMGLQSAISQVKDLLPHLGDGFIAMCLRLHKMDVSAVINAVLEDTLPVALKETDFSLSEIPDDILMEVEREYESAPSTSKSRPTPTGFKEFKRVEYSSYKEMFNDKSVVNQAKSIYEKFRNTEEDDVYNDDYDEDYEERLFAPPVEVDAEGFYTEYTNLPVCNPNHKYVEEQAYEEEDRPQSGDVRQSHPESGNWRNRNPTGSYENPGTFRDRGEPPKSRKNNRNRKKTTSGSSQTQDGQDRPESRAKEDGGGSKATTSRSFRARIERDERRPTESQNDHEPNARDCLEETDRQNERRRGGWRYEDRPLYHHPHYSDSRESRNQGSRAENPRIESQNWRRDPPSRDHYEENHRENDHRQEPSSGGPKPLDFCENPEITRARREHQRQVKLEKRRGPPQSHNRNPGDSGTSRQEDNEQNERHYKNVHKSSNANHGRKFYSDKKRRQ